MLVFSFEPLSWENVWATCPLRGGMSKEDLCMEALGIEAPVVPCASEEDGDTTPLYTVHNIVSTSLVQGYPMPINLQQLCMLLPCSGYNRRKFAAITIRIDNPHCTALLFTSGKLVITGVKSWYECLLASLSISRIITRTMLNSSFKIVNCEIQNIVSHSEIPLVGSQRLNIQRMYENMSIECTYQRNMFPGLIYRGWGCPVVLLCFYSGKVVLTGGKTIKDIETGWRQLWGMVKLYVQ